MNRRQAGRLGTDAARFFHAHEDYTEDQANAANTAFSLQAEQFLPESSSAAVIEHENGLPLIVAADDTHLYTLEVVAYEDDALGPATSRATMRRMDPERCQISCDARYRGSHSFGRVRLSTWRIRVEDLDFAIETRTDEDGESDDREAFAQHVALALGWSFDRRPSEDELAETA